MFIYKLCINLNRTCESDPRIGPEKNNAYWYINWSLILKKCIIYLLWKIQKFWKKCSKSPNRKKNIGILSLTLRFKIYLKFIISLQSILERFVKYMFSKKNNQFFMHIFKWHYSSLWWMHSWHWTYLLIWNLWLC